ncbi:type II secretion system F family protein [Corynebacterium efficiens]|nr:type II secretion system F family protein [Corynebacterium efficiens]
MVSALILLAAGIAVPGQGPAGGRGVVKRPGRGPLPPVAITAGVPVCVALFAATGIDPATVVALLTAGLVVSWRLKRGRTSRVTRAQTTVLAGFLGLCIGNLRAGAPMADAMDHALAHTTGSTGSAGPTTVALTAAARRVRSGGSGAAVLIDAPTMDLQRLGTIWEVSERHGIPLVRLLDQLKHRLEAQERHRQASAAQLQGPQATAVILALLPLAGVLMGTAMGADPIGFLTGGGVGGILLITGVLLSAAGFILTEKILEGASPT